VGTGLLILKALYSREVIAVQGQHYEYSPRPTAR